MKSNISTREIHPKSSLINYCTKYEVTAFCVVLAFPTNPLMLFLHERVKQSISPLTLSNDVLPENKLACLFL